jgi:stringent starvation protein B
LYIFDVNPKRQILEEVLGRSWAFLQLDGRAEGVDLPEWLREPSVILQIGYDMPVAIPDLELSENGVTATLSFRRIPHKCIVPWHAIFAITDVEGQGVMFPADVPADLPAAGAPSVAPAGQVRSTMEVSPVSEPRPEPPSGGKLKSGKPRPSHLKLVP